MIYVNLKEEYSGMGGHFFTWILYSGHTRSKIKKQVIEDILERHEWVGDLEDLEDLDLSGSLENVVARFEHAIGHGAPLDLYSINVSPAYSDLETGWRFYQEYLDLLRRIDTEESADVGEADLAFRGPNGPVLQKLFSYLQLMEEDLEVTVDWEKVRNLLQL